MSVKIRDKLTLISRNSSISGYFVITENKNIPSVLFENKIYLSKDRSSKSRTLFIKKPDLIIEESDQFLISEELSYLSEGDIVYIGSNHKINVVYRRAASSTFVLTTEQCDNFCIMCSQPPKKIDDSYIIDELMLLIPLLPQHLHELGVSGGEPTLMKDKFIKLLEKIKAYLPNTAIHVLSNGKNMNHSLVSKISQTHHKDLMFGIPLYSSDYRVHDYIVQSKGAFQQTVAGIINLKQYKQKVEIRVVIQKQNYTQLGELAEFISRNLQFVDQVVFMGLEMTGFAKQNVDNVWIEPDVYQAELVKAINLLTRAKVKALIYNHQMCILDKKLWRYNVASISDWKNSFISECDSCSMKSTCGGFFTTSQNKLPKAIRAI
jgi:His-Xaa-Ser system radical SAM maturase HxsC